MGTKELRTRGVWQDVGGAKAGIAETSFYTAFLEHFENTDYQIRPKPREFKDVYSKVLLHDTVLANIYNPGNITWTHGVIPDYAIGNVVTKKTLYVEVKRQDGWVEGKERKAGRGNAHERSCKYFTPGLLNILRTIGKLGDNVLPFWTVFQGDIARDPKRVREVTCWYGEYSDHFCMWCDSASSEPLLRHFDAKLKKLLD